ncbi:asparagine synthetase [Streptomyces davaonensis JCM 4913]|uniref:asparagine synthase (glutamine-hydrolyzing) n=1 Tax=Streptomyces davaonensis (strain DSM 101723 / JCM 4913 / KCC S-0913 / 768) TaxID=1214101 RepID=K4QWB1_STRDJ|nr:asparagine synthase-related protein [Streptomyces davaonensis]CCK24679.1 asparagine synthetase [Streptomyces davaonensis JCM 4913]
MVLPDCRPASPIAAALRDRTPERVDEIDHASGRPWILGHWPQDALTLGGAGRNRIAVIGQHAVTTKELWRVAMDPHARLDGLARSAPGSAHLIASVDGRVRIQGTVTSMRRVCHVRVRGITVAADHADVLARLADLPLDEPCLALRLLEPFILPPLTRTPVWRGVTEVPGGSSLLIDESGRPRHLRWWTPPEPELPMAEGAPALRDALAAAVAVRTDRHGTVSCDLGGLDSTAVCCLAAHRTPRVAACTIGLRDARGDDVPWAVRTAAALGSIEHHVIPATDVPLFYAGVHNLDDPLEEPTSGGERERGLVTVRHAADLGSTTHLTGMGGDELLYGSLAHLHTLARTRPRLAARLIRGFCAKYRWPRAAVLRQLADRRPYGAWLLDVADHLVEPQPPLNDPLLAWGFTPRLPPWTTPDAATAVRDLVREAAHTALPLAGRRGQHRELAAMQAVSRVAAEVEEMGARIGMTVASPYYDDRVIEAGLAVRPEDRITPWRYKPLIQEAMRGVVPEETRVRQTKATADCDEAPGLRRHRAALLALWEESRLARLGLIDADAVRDVCARPLDPRLGADVLYQTVACETWLRAIERPLTGLPKEQEES